LANRAKRKNTNSPPPSFTSAGGITQKGNAQNIRMVNQAYDANQYIKSDLKWSTIATVIVLAIMIVCYLIFR